MQNLTPAAPARWSLAAVPRRQWLAEWLIIVLVAVLATRSVHDFSNQSQLTGVDFITLTRSASIAGHFARTTGAIPLWNPLIGNGEPMLESAQSFILNPLMSAGIMIAGDRPGVLIVILVHAVLFGWGGWAWGRVMGFGAAGRLLMGALLVSSGSMTGPLSHGTIQLALSQAYLPWIFAGITAMLYIPHQRWGLTLFVTATMLLMFSGTFWYVLPAAFGCALIALFSLVSMREGRLRLEIGRLRSLLLAGAFTVGAVAIRLLPIQRDLLYHPLDSYPWNLSYFQVFANFFDRNYTADMGQWFVIYHYVVPAGLALAVAVGAAFAWRTLMADLRLRWRVFAAGVIFVLLIAVVGMGPTPLFASLQEAIPILQDWRNPGRMAAAASPWVVLFVCWGFDHAIRFALVGLPKPGLARIGRLALGAALGLIAVWGVADVASNWPTSLFLRSIEGHFPVEVHAARLLRELYPSQFLIMHADWIDHTALHENLIRHALGDNDVFTIGLPPTIGGEQWVYDDEFAFGDSDESGNGIWLKEHGYVELAGVPREGEIGAVLDVNPNALPFAYLVPEQTLLDQGDATLIRAQTTAVTYYHRIDEIAVEISGATEGSVLVVQETAYPGWTVTVNGQPAPLESVHRRIAVRIPSGVTDAEIVFRYQPDRLYLGAVITIITLALLAAYALRADRLLGRRSAAGATEPAPASMIEENPAPAVAPVAEEAEALAELAPLVSARRGPVIGAAVAVSLAAASMAIFMLAWLRNRSQRSPGD